jgi:hypothetical protein
VLSAFASCANEKAVTAKLNNATINKNGFKADLIFL